MTITLRFSYSAFPSHIKTLYSTFNYSAFHGYPNNVYDFICYGKLLKWYLNVRSIDWLKCVVGKEAFRRWLQSVPVYCLVQRMHRPCKWLCFMLSGFYSLEVDAITPIMITISPSTHNGLRTLVIWQASWLRSSLTESLCHDLSPEMRACDVFTAYAVFVYPSETFLGRVPAYWLGL